MVLGLWQQVHVHERGQVLEWACWEPSPADCLVLSASPMLSCRTTTHGIRRAQLMQELCHLTVEWSGQWLMQLSVPVCLLLVDSPELPRWAAGWAASLQHKLAGSVAALCHKSGTARSSVQA